MALEESLTPYNRFLKSVPNPYTRHQYERGMTIFLEFTRTSPEELVKASPTAIEDALKSCMEDLDAKGKSHGTKAMLVNAVRKFTRVNKVKDIDWDDIRQALGEDESEHDDQPYPKELIQKLMQAADLRKKVIIGIFATAGIRRAALAPLKLKNTKKLKLDNGAGDVYALEIYANSRRSRYTTFVTPEITAIIDDYLQSRKASGEMLGPDSPLVREQYDTESVNKPRHITQSTTAQLVESLIIHAGIKEEIQERKIHILHAFRKTVYSTLVQAGVKEISIKKVMGHSTGLGRNYDRTELSDVLQDYAMAINALSISDAAEWREKAGRLQQTLDDKIKDIQSQLDAFNQWKKDKEALESKPQIQEQKKKRKA
jgi:site-specific recombinase XerD